MNQFNRLLYFEWKKIWKHKSIWITLGILIAFYFILQCPYIFGNTTINDTVLETRLEGIRKDAQYGRRLSGRKINDSLLQEMQKAFNKFVVEDDSDYILDEEYQTTARPYQLLNKTLKNMLWESGINPQKISAQQFYDARSVLITENWDRYRLTSTEKAYWQEKEDRLNKPFTYQYAEGYDYLISMSGIYMVCMLSTFLSAICLVTVFTEEHGRKTDQMILCSRMGRRQIYYAKIAAGTLSALLAAGILYFIAVMIAFFTYGADGFSAQIQLSSGTVSDGFTVGQVFLMMSGILFLSVIMTGMFTMVLSEITKSGVAAMAVVIGILFGARMIPIPEGLRVLSQLWNYIPINLLKSDAGFQDVRLVSLFGLNFRSWEISIILYIFLIIILVIAGKKIYCGYQVGGR